MRTLTLTAPAVLFAGVALAPTASASPFDARLVAADAGWVIHVDVTAALESEIGHFMLDHMHEFGADMDDLKQIHDWLHFDPFEAIYGVTLYGFDEPGDDFVAIVIGSDDIAEGLAEAAEEDGSPVERVRGGFMIGDDVRVHVVEGRRANLYVFAEEEDLARDALKVLDGRTSNMAEADWGGIEAPDEPGVLAFVAFAGSLTDLMDEDDLEDLSHLGPAERFIAGASDFSAFIAESRGEFTLGVRFYAENEAEAEGFEQLLHGLVGMAHGIAAMNQDAEMDEEFAMFMDLLAGVRIDSEDRLVTVGLTYDVEDVLELIEEADF
ncbi:MAG: hypothetical protein D6693_07715 [Planctomycetota bacterium]|nr:MAG: hypothetical protein D6693_07715 [Planctomycetota bacterium]